MGELLKNFPSKKRLIFSILSLFFHFTNDFDSETLSYLPQGTSLCITASTMLMIVHITLVIVSLILLFWGMWKGGSGDEENGARIWKIGIILNTLSFVCLVAHLALAIIGAYVLVPQSLNKIV